MGKIKRGTEATPSSAVAQLGRATNRNYQAFAEADAIDREKREVDVVIITEGPGNSVDKHYYSEKAMRSGVKKWDGARAFLNHQSEAEEEARPEQDVREQCGFYRGTKLVRVYDPRQLKMVWGIGGTFVAENSAEGQKALALAEAQILWSKLYPNSPECYAGISVNTGGWSDGEVKIDDEEWVNVVAFENIRSADFVTRPARGGAFLRLAESMSPVGDNTSTEELSMKNAKKMRQLFTNIEESEKKAKAATDPAERKRFAKESVKLQAELKKLIEADDTVPPKDKTGADDGDNEEAEEDDVQDGDGSMAALMKHFPKQDGEEEEAYKDRVRQAMKCAAEALGAGEAEDEGEEAEDDGEEAPPKKQSVRHRESVALRTFRKTQPAIYTAMATELRESLGEERRDFKSIKSANESLKKHNGEMKLKLAMIEATKKLEKAGIPKKFLSPAMLVKLDAEAQEAEISRVQLIMESAGASTVWGGERSSTGSDDEGGLDLAGAGIPMKARESEGEED